MSISSNEIGAVVVLIENTVKVIVLVSPCCLFYRGLAVLLFQFPVRASL